MINLFNKLGVKRYQIYKYSRKNGKHKSSVIRVGCNADIKLFGDYIYQNYDGIGLKRKYEYYQSFLNLIPKMKLSKTSQYKGVCFNNRNKKWKSSLYNKKTKKDFHFGWFNTELEAYNARKNYMDNNNLVDIEKISSIKEPWIS